MFNGMSELLAGKVQSGFGDASRWLKLFNAAYSEKLGMSVFLGSLNIALDHVFDWFDARYETHRILVRPRRVQRRARHTCCFPAN